MWQENAGGGGAHAGRRTTVAPWHARNRTQAARVNKWQGSSGGKGPAIAKPFGDDDGALSDSDSSTSSGEEIAGGVRKPGDEQKEIEPLRISWGSLVKYVFLLVWLHVVFVVCCFVALFASELTYARTHAHTYIAALFCSGLPAPRLLSRCVTNCTRRAHPYSKWKKSRHGNLF